MEGIHIDLRSDPPTSSTEDVLVQKNLCILGLWVKENYIARTKTKQPRGRAQPGLAGSRQGNPTVGHHIDRVDIHTPCSASIGRAEIPVMENLSHGPRAGVVLHQITGMELQRRAPDQGWSSR